MRIPLTKNTRIERVHIVKPKILYRACTCLATYANAHTIDLEAATRTSGVDREGPGYVQVVVVIVSKPHQTQRRGQRHRCTRE